MVTIEQVLAAMPWGGPCCDEHDDIVALVYALEEGLGRFRFAQVCAVSEALYGKPWCTDDDNDRRQIAETVCKVLNG